MEADRYHTWGNDPRKDKLAAENLSYQMHSDSFLYGQVPSAYKEPTSLAMYSGNPQVSYNPSVEGSPKLLTRYSNWSSLSNEQDVETSTEYLVKNFNNLGVHPEKQPGWGWEINVVMPGNKNNERITLNEFNAISLLHTNQHGKGSWFDSNLSSNSSFKMYSHSQTALTDNYNVSSDDELSFRERSLKYASIPIYTKYLIFTHLIISRKIRRELMILNQN